VSSNSPANQPLASVDLERLKLALTSGLQFGATEIRFLNIDVYRVRLGDKWQACRGFIHSFVLTATERHLSPSDFLIPSSSGYVLVFARADGGHVNRISKRIADDLDAMLSRVEDLQHPPMSCVVVAVDTATLCSHLQAPKPASGAPDTGASGRRMSQDAQQGECASQLARYAPFRHQKTRKMAGSLSVPAPVPNSRRVLDRAYYEPSDVRTQTDIQMFGELLGAAYQLQKSGKSAAVVFSINFKNFCEPSLQKKYIHALRQTPASLLRCLTPRFVRVPHGTHRTLIMNKLDSVTSIFRNVAIHVKPTVEVATLEFLPFAMISTSWSDIELAAGTQGDDSHRHAELTRIATTFCQSARILRARSMVDGLDTAEALDIMTSADADFISGPVVGALGNALHGQAVRETQPVHMSQESSRQHQENIANCA
jgi:hypothetical protein